MPSKRRNLTVEVADQLRSLIKTEFAVGQKLPAESDLADRLGISRSTLREAISVLWQEGILQKKWGVGTIVLHNNTSHAGAPLSLPLLKIQPDVDLIRDSGCTPGVLHQSVTSRRAESLDASLTGVQPGDELWVIDRVLTADGEPVMRSIDLIPQVIKGLAFDGPRFDAMTNPMIAMLAAMPGCAIERVEGALSAVGASEDTAQLLAVPAGTPLLRTESTAYAADGTIVAFSAAQYRSEKLDLRFARARRLSR